LYGNVAVRHLAQHEKYYRCDAVAAGTFHLEGSKLNSRKKKDYR
jgi:hypothetical protein